MKKLILTGMLSLVMLSSLPLFAQHFLEVKKETAPHRAAYDWHGYSVSVSGNYAIAGTFMKDTTLGNQSIMDAGSATIYEKNASGSWSIAQEIVSHDLDAQDWFGQAVAISGDFAVVGASHEDHDSSGNQSILNAGSVYIFKRNLNGSWQEIQKITASDREYEGYFGFSVSISGRTLAVGAMGTDKDAQGLAPLTDPGAVYLFEPDASGVWQEVQKLCASDRAGWAYLGYSVSISGDRLVAGAYGEQKNAAGTMPINGAGAAYVFEKNSNGLWVESQKLIAQDRASDDWFGYSVGIAGDHLIVGAIFEDEDALGSQMVPEAGSAYFFKRDISGNWTQNQKITAQDRGLLDNFGSSVAISGNKALIGAYFDHKDSLGVNLQAQAGSAYFFEYFPSSGWTQSQKVTASDREASAYYGVSVALDGSVAVVGAHGENKDVFGSNPAQDAGAVYMLQNCFPTYVTISHKACDSYHWNGNQLSQTGVYQDTLLSRAGCDSIVTLYLTLQQVDTTVSQTAFALTSNAGNATYQWLDCESGFSPVPGAVHSSFSTNQAGNFAVAVTQNGCVDTSACYSLLPFSTYLQNGLTSNAPFIKAGALHIDLGGLQSNVQAKVVHLSGKVVYTGIHQAIHSLKISLDGPKGMYFVELTLGKRSPKIYKIIKN